MKTTPDELTHAERRAAAAMVTHVEITTDIAIWDENNAQGVRPCPVPEKKEGQDDPKPGQQLAAAQPAKD